MSYLKNLLNCIFCNNKNKKPIFKHPEPEFDLLKAMERLPKSMDGKI